MINLGVQYYRPPFPIQKHWEDDFKRIRDAGLNCVQLWVLWSWVESRPGSFRFDDYDRLVELAAKNALGVVLSLIGEVQPYWIHREVPGSEMVDHMGNVVVSSNRQECHFGITPGGCTDDPVVWERMAEFLTRVTERYRGAEHLRGWDAWNELRWNVHADGRVCYCPHTLRAFRAWLSERHGGLDGLNAAWLRRYGEWEEVAPGKEPSRPYTEMMAFQHFLTERASRHGRDRYDLVKRLSPHTPVTVHGGCPTPQRSGSAFDQALNRGNDWDFADHLDGVGTSSFPKWQNMDIADFAVRLHYTRSAARGKRMWLSELQGGRASTGFDVHRPVDAPSQQRWIWNGLACGADTILFWCWRDEVFGRESGGFGLVGADGYAEERLAAMRATGKALEKHSETLAAYEPDPPQAGVLFSPQTYYLEWAQEGSAKRAYFALQGHCRALLRRGVPYRVVEENRLGALDGLNILFMPRTLVVDEAAAQALGEFVREGGTLVCESECGAFDSHGLYRYPEERFLAKLAGAAEVGRRTLEQPSVHVSADGRDFTLRAEQWLTPWRAPQGEVLAKGEDGALIARVPVGAGRVVLCGSYFGGAYLRGQSEDFEAWVEALVRSAGVCPPVTATAEDGAFVHAQTGRAEGRRVAFAFCEAPDARVELRFAKGFFERPVWDIVSGASVEVAASESGQALAPTMSPWGMAALAEAED